MKYCTWIGIDGWKYYGSLSEEEQKNHTSLEFHDTLWDAEQFAYKFNMNKINNLGSEPVGRAEEASTS